MNGPLCGVPPKRRTTPSTTHPAGNQSSERIAADVCIIVGLASAARSGFASRARLLHLPPRDPSDFDLAFVLAGLRKIVGHLQPQPGLRTTTERLVEAD